MTYLGLCWRQKSFALFAEPAAWQRRSTARTSGSSKALGGAGREELTMAFEAFRAQRERRRPRARGASGSVRAVDRRSTSR